MNADPGVAATRAHPSSWRGERGVFRARTVHAATRRPLTLNGFGAFDAADVDTERANSARIDDYLLGGKDNYQTDRTPAEGIKALGECGPALVRANRVYLADAVRAAAARGVCQVLDIGAGLDPATAHAAAQAALLSGRAARVVLLDNDPVTLVNLQAQWERDESHVRSAALYGDLRWPEETFLSNPRLFDVLDLDGPIMVVLGAVLHHIEDCDLPQQAVARLMRVMPSGSLLVITHATGVQRLQEAEAWAQCYRDAQIPLVPRTGEQIAGFFDGLVLSETGLVPLETVEGHEPELTWMYSAAGYAP